MSLTSSRCAPRVSGTSVNHVLIGDGAPANGHGELFVQPWVSGGAKDIVERRQVRNPAAVKQRVVLTVGIRIADKVMQR